MIQKRIPVDLTLDELQALIGICEIFGDHMPAFAAKDPHLMDLMETADDLGERFMALLSVEAA